MSDIQEMQQSIGLAKVAPVPITQPLPPIENVEVSPAQPPQTAISAPSWEGIPVEIIRYFGKDLGTIETKEIEQLRDIDRWSKVDSIEDTIGNRLQRLKGLEIKLGAPGYHETKLSKIWNWVKMDFSINELRKRQSAFER